MGENITFGNVIEEWGSQLIVIGGSASSSLSRSLAKTLGATLAKVDIKRFPDGECYVRIKDDLKGEEAIVVQTTFPDRNLVELFILLDAVQDLEPSGLVTVVPYFGYARQDKRFNDGEAVSARVFSRLIDSLTDEFISVDIHTTKLMEWFNVPSKDVSVMPSFGNFLKDKGVDLVLSPDRGALGRAKVAAQALGCDWDHLEKTRIDGDNVQMAPKDLDAMDRTVAIVDDIIATGGTIIRATEALRAQGAKKVFAVCTHGLYTKNALERLEPALDAIYSADTIENPTTVISAADAIGSYLKKR